MKLFVFLLVLLLLIFLMLPLKVYIEYADGKLVFKIKIAGITLKKKGKRKQEQAPKKETPQEKKKAFDKDTLSLHNKASQISELCKTTCRLGRKYIKNEKLSVNISMGTGDAATTAVGIGALWAVVYGLIAIISKIVIIDNHKVDITPDYSEASFKANAECILSSRIVYIIIIAITILIKLKPLKGKEE